MQGWRSKHDVRRTIHDARCTMISVFNVKLCYSALVGFLQGAPAMTPKQALFVEEYALDHNAARSARASGYAERSARITGSQLLTNPNVSRAIQALEDAAAVTSYP